MVASFQRGRTLAALALGFALAWLPAASFAQTCPFDNGGSDAINDGLVLTRYAMGITGAPLTASTRYASLDPLQVKNNIECLGCTLDMNGDGQIDTVDTTIIARHLSGFKGASLTAGLALGVAPIASRPTTAAVVSFLAAGCAAGPNGPFVKGGNSFGSAAVLGTNDAFNLKVASGGTQVSLEVGNGSGLRVIKSTNSGYPDGAVVVNGSVNNSAFGSTVTVAGGGFGGSTCVDPVTGVSPPRSCGNSATGDGSTISGGWANDIDDDIDGVIGGVISGGLNNRVFGDLGTIAGGYLNEGNTYSSIGGGQNNKAFGNGSTIPGGEYNRASGQYAFAAGRYTSATHNGVFVWGDSTTTTPIASTAANQFVIRSAGGVHLSPETRLYFRQGTRQMINLWGTSATTPDDFGIGVQTGTAYFRSNSNFCWHKGGTHDNAFCAPGGTGTVQMALRDTAVATTAVGHLYAASFNIGSDRAVKTAITSINPRTVLNKVLAMPITSWAYKTDSTTRHIGPMAQDFHKAFGLGGSDKSIATVDADGVALAAIQGLHQLVKDKDAKIGALEKLNATMQKKLAAIEKRLGM
jgi:trimeric autotransporter adhesin